MFLRGNKQVILILLLCLLGSSSSEPNYTTNGQSSGSDNSSQVDPSNVNRIQNYLENLYNLDGYTLTDKHVKSINETGMVYSIKYQNSQNYYKKFEAFLSFNHTFEVIGFESDDPNDTPQNAPIVQVDASNVRIVQDYLEDHYNLTGYTMTDKHIKSMNAIGIAYIAMYVNNENHYHKFEVFVTFQNKITVLNEEKGSTIPNYETDNVTIKVAIKKKIYEEYNLTKLALYSQQQKKEGNGTVHDIQFVDSDGYYQLLIVYVKNDDTYEVRRLLRPFPSTKIEELKRATEANAEQQETDSQPQVERKTPRKVTWVEQPGGGMYKKGETGESKLKSILRTRYNLKGYHVRSIDRSEAYYPRGMNYDISFTNFRGGYQSFQIFMGYRGQFRVIEHHNY